MSYQKISIFLFYTLLLFPIHSFSQECNVSPQKKQVITGLLCGQNALEKEYHFYKKGCAMKSISLRFEDSAKQIFSLKKCGDKDFARKHEDATLKAAQIMQEMLPCTGENFIVSDIMKQKMLLVENRAKELKCNNKIHKLLESQKPKYESMINIANDPRVRTNILEKLKIKILDNGDIVE